MRRRALEHAAGVGRRSEAGVTLIELLAVVVILGVIAGVAIPSVMSSIENSKVNTTKQSMAVIAEALQRYAVQAGDGKFPKQDNYANIDTSNASVLLNNTNGGPYLQGFPNDGWGHSFQYKSDGDTFDIKTTGSDDQYWHLSSNMTTPSNNSSGS
ncbi:MAG: type II secretion system protein GspG [Alicyclobacillus macrosporangiidus]|nr:type II secretion system protein GspG [Alicyclobacillus macrosporangiidus]